MAQASIPVDLFNPGQVFACLGFLEAAEVLLGHAEGGFDWDGQPEPRFVLRADGQENPFHTVLEFLAKAQVQRLAPPDYTEENDLTPSDGPLCRIDTFPGGKVDQKTLPVRFVHAGRCLCLDLTHWCDGSSRDAFKLFAGQQRSASIASQMLKALRELWTQRWEELVGDPFGLLMPLGGSSFKLDARKSWTTIGAGYSPDDQKNAVAASPVVEILAALGLEHARPVRFEKGGVRYGVWKGLLPPVLARPALGGIRVGVPLRTFRFTLDKAGQNEVVTFAQEEVTE
jgi:CRISPR-associated protein Csb3